MPNLGAIICVAKVDLSPKPLSNTIWTVTCYMAFMNVIMKVINKELGIIWDDHERCEHLTNIPFVILRNAIHPECCSNTSGLTVSYWGHQSAVN